MTGGPDDVAAGDTAPEASMRCPACGARNVPTADWCSQCFANLGDDIPIGASLDGPPARTPGVPPAGTRVTSEDDGRDVREADGRVEWRCGVCQGWNALELASCHTCATPRRGFGPESRLQPGHVRTARRVAWAVASVAVALLLVAGALALFAR